MSVVVGRIKMAVFASTQYRERRFAAPTWAGVSGAYEGPQRPGYWLRSLRLNLDMLAPMGGAACVIVPMRLDAGATPALRPGARGGPTPASMDCQRACSGCPPWNRPRFILWSRDNRNDVRAVGSMAGAGRVVVLRWLVDSWTPSSPCAPRQLPAVSNASNRLDSRENDQVRLFPSWQRAGRATPPSTRP